MNTRFAFALKSPLAIAIAATIASAAHAQTPGATAALEEIVVTAERRELNLQEVPASATVLTADSLARQGIDNVIEIQQVAPAVAINTYNRSTFINIRGVGIAQSAPTSNPGVAFYIDGNFIPHEHFIAQSFYDIESIEVLRGPQGTLTGQNSTGGAVYVRTPTPDFEDLSGYVDLTAADYDWHRATGALNIPMGDVVAVRLAAMYDEKDSFTENIGPSPSEPGASESKGARATVRIKPSDGLTFDLRYEYFDLQSDYNPVKNRRDAVTSNPFIIEEDAISYLNQEGYRASAEARIDLGTSVQLRALTSYLDADNVDQADGDRTATALPQPPPTNTGRVGYTDQGFETSVTEVNLLSIGDNPLQWVVGAFYMDETTPTRVLRDNRNTVTLVQSNSTIDTEAVNESRSVFGQIDWRLTDAFALDVGARYSEDEQEYTRNLIPGAPPGCFPCTTTAESDEVTGRVGLKFFASDDAMLYGTVSRGYKAGGNNLDPRLGSFGPETNEVIEFGAKTEILDGRLRVNGDVYYSIYDGVQLSALTSVGAGPLLPNTLNGPEAEIYGAELELQAQFGGFGFNFGASYMESQFSEAGLVTDTQTNTNRPIVEGQGMPFAPAYTLSAGVEYEFLFGDMSLTPRVQASYLDEQYATPFKYAETRVPSRTITDARLTFNPNDKLTIEAFCSNIFDKTYIAVQLQDASSAAGGYIFGAPRQYGARLKYSF
ncbi:MAG TPA: TonB-dependent receptor [Steroidobacteraceae bacterium]|nr:TonB-dependent receptor [Steroidobacteraceae bacterium]